MKDVATPVPQNEVRGVIKKCLENAALVNYERLSEEARIEGNVTSSSAWTSARSELAIFFLS